MNKSGHTRHFYLLCLAARSAAFVFLVAYALIAPERFDTDLAAPLGRITPLSVVWLLLMLSMAVRLFPSKSESLGCQKEFARRFRPTGLLPSSQEIHHANRGAAVVLAVWIASNAVVFGLHFQGWLSQPGHGVPGRILRCMRHCLHSVFLPLPGLDDAQPLLHHLPDL